MQLKALRVIYCTESRLKSFVFDDTDWAYTILGDPALLLFK